MRVEDGMDWTVFYLLALWHILVTECQGWHEHWQCCIFCECGRASCTLWPRLKYTLASMCVPMCDDGEVWILEKPGDWSSTTKDQFLGWIFPGFNRSLLYHTCNYINSRDGNQDLELRKGFSQDIFFGGKERGGWSVSIKTFSIFFCPATLLRNLQSCFSCDFEKCTIFKRWWWLSCVLSVYCKRCSLRRVVNRIWLYNPPGFLVKAGKCFMTLWATDSIPFNSAPSHRTSTQLTIMQEELRAETKVPVAVPVLVLTNILNILNPCSTSFTMPKKLPQLVDGGSLQLDSCYF